jgi:hypothetical protein
VRLTEHDTDTPHATIRFGGTSAAQGGVQQRTMSASPYRAAIEQTENAIQRRATFFRNQVIVVSLILVGAITAAVATGSITVLSAALLLIPLSGSFLITDGVLVMAWRSTLIAAWVAGDMDFATFRHTIRVHPMLPKSTLEGMLATLPYAGQLLEEQALGAPTRQAIAAASTAMHGQRSDVLLFKVVASGIVVFATLAAIWTRDWRPLTAFAGLSLLQLVRVWRHRRRLVRLEAEVASRRPDPRFSEADYQRVRVALQQPTSFGAFD